jgi:hypothetical protein
MSRCEDCPDQIYVTRGDDSDSYLYDNKPKKPPVVIDSDRHIVGQVARKSPTLADRQSTDWMNK